MFERYTERARRAIFFARYEASQFGLPLIETEHLLLGLLRENKELIRYTLLQVDHETVRQDIASRIKPGERTSTSVDLPLSDHAKRALAYAAEEPERLNHRYIGTEHLLLGLMREKEFASAEFLSRFGASLESLRKRAEGLGDPKRREELHRRPRRSPSRSVSPPSMVEIHGVKRNLEHIRIFVSRCMEYAWHREQKPWKARDVVMKKDGKGFSFDLTLTERPDEFVLVPGGWKKDGCAICYWELFESDDASHGIGFNNGRDWLCAEYHQRFIVGNLFASPYSVIT
jgi:ATP-dependent Clp protease ATP-binding subunit ClpA